MVTTRLSRTMKKKTTGKQKMKPTFVKSFPRKWKLLVEEKNYFMARIGIYSSFKVIDKIKRKLTHRQQELFAQTCFGRFLQLQPIRFSTNLIHEILLRQLVCPTGEYSMWFRIGGKECEFGLKEFALITSLDCSEIGSLEGKLLSNRICDRYFHGKDRVNGKIFDWSFETCNADNDEDAVKLAQLYLLERFLLSKDSRSLTEKFSIRLVDNAEEFNKFPWGRYVYELTVKSMKRALKNQIEKFQNKSKKHSNMNYKAAYRLHGFPFVIQYWAYEFLPLTKKQFGDGVGKNMPQMLNWSCSSQLNFEMLKKEVFNVDRLQVKSGLQPMEDETNEEHLYYNTRRKKLKEKNGTAITKEANVECAQEKIMRRKNVEEYENDGIHMNEDKGDREQHYKSAEMSVKLLEVNKQPSNVTVMVYDVLSESEDQDENKDKFTVQRKCKTGNLGSEGDIPCFTVDLFEHPTPDEKTEFDQWIKAGLKRNTRKNKYTDVSNKLQPGFNFTILTCEEKDWFFLLNETAQWLNNSHVDVALYFLRKKKMDHPDVFKHRCTTTDFLFYAILNARYPKFKQERENFLWDKETFIQKILKGVEPLRSLPWVDVDIVYIPVNVRRKHWVLAVLDLKKQTIFVYDSYRAAKHDKETMLACCPIAEMVPCMLKSIRFFDAREDLKDLTSPLDIKLVNGIPQQDNGGDCGMFMLKFTEFLMQETPLETCTQENISFFRNKMAVELYAYGKKMMAKD